ncbi:OLC1v1015058C1 [Oldenlandia corymbosa var. corymbosa]|uniref:OLC1v1015058C1 n=1 Tax=Oldenlandia corymbosa var. corymbosa TaxID=529605 RepID=A0AAV1E2E5_OLDCO|nr:OLC1v1015058C1 [Oldenlandia corymbosa var. corymbosa]
MGSSFCLGRVVVFNWLLLLSTSLIMAFKEGVVVDGGSIMEEVCSWTSEDNLLFCINCLKGKVMVQQQQEEGGHEDEIKRLAGRLIDCARETSEVSRLFMINFCNNSTGTKFGEVGKFCVPKLGKAEVSFQAAREFWKYGRKTITLREIENGFNAFHECAIHFPNGFPNMVYVTLNRLRVRCEMAEDVINSIPAV